MHDSDPLQAWHTFQMQDLYERLDTQPSGLDQHQAQERLLKFGVNRLPEGRPRPWWDILLHQFQSPLIYILGLAAIVSVLLADVKDAAFIGLVLAINSVIGCYQEWRAEQSSYALRKLLEIRATVIRDREAIEISAQEVVPGDLVLLESGNRVPADTRLVSTTGLEIDESLLTGESLSVLKDSDWIGSHLTPLADRRNMAYAGSIVMRGRALGVVVATGTKTSVGQLALDVLGQTAGKAPLQLRMESFTRWMAVALLIAIGVLAVTGVLVGKYSVAEMLLFAVALAVSAIPEGLPVAMTIALSVAATRMAKRGVIVRRLTAVEGLGSCTLVAADKTGTLTCNELMIARVDLPDGAILRVTGQGFTPIGQVFMDESPISIGDNQHLERLVRCGVLCNESDLHHRNGSWVWRGDAVDIAIQCLGIKLGVIRQQLSTDFPQRNQIPFEPEHQFAATFHRNDHQTLVCVKGSPERILSMCAKTIGSDRLSIYKDQANRMAQEGFRVLALAEGQVSKDVLSIDAPEIPTELSFLGLIGMLDPLRPGIKQAILKCHQAGVQVMMITGDHRATAMSIAKEIGLIQKEDQVITGQELMKSPDLIHSSDILRYRVFARVSPRQKLDLVQTARNAGHFVAVTGDGVNDAPAMRIANIGVAMGKAGTDVAREASSLVISDDNFATIVSGIEEGRVAYDNIRKVIYLSISTGAAEVLLMALAILSGIPYLPLLPVQLLWLNLVTNGIQDVALAFEANEGDVLERKPRSPDQPIFDRIMIERTIIAALTMGLISYFLFVWLLPKNPTQQEVASTRNSLLLLLVLFQNIHIGNCRSETKSAFVLSPLRSPILLAGTLLAFTVHVAAMHLPIGQTVLETSPVSPQRWALVLFLALLILPLSELHKWVMATTLNRRSESRRSNDPPNAQNDVG
ncbi:MAG: HAD-IC family P-type ATPase [Planctomycetaceae bacterium]|nr:HAD-IC family P-type ATPase [Planctomycetaceae bacterium]MCE2813786.1 HAD-IC family P-type ATPase [Planctomycetaceae bacterium]